MTAAPEPRCERTELLLRGAGMTAAPEQAEVYEIEFSFCRPPLTANRRGHWSKWAPIIADVRKEAAWRAKAAKIPAAHHITVQLHYAPGNQRKLDAPNLTGTSKPVIDGLVDAKIVVDDSDEYVTELMPQIHRPPAPGPRCWLTVEIAS